MMDTMYTTGFGSSALLWPLHGVASIAILTGVALLIVWAIKTFTPAQLKKWGIGLVAAGAVACLLATAITPRFTLTSFSNGKMVRMEGMNTMMHGDDEDGEENEMDEMMDNMMGGDNAMDMSMNDMSSMLEGKTGDEFDKAFIEGMIPHHQGAIDMATLAQINAKHGEIRELATNIIAAQQNEIDMMQQWLKDWGYAE